MDDERTYRQGFEDGFQAACQASKESDISSGTACLLVKSKNLNRMEAPFYQWPKENGFHKWTKDHGCYDSVDWVYINLNSKIFNPGMPGIPLTSILCNHAITIDESRTIYAIYSKYKNKNELEF